MLPGCALLSEPSCGEVPQSVVTVVFSINVVEDWLCAVDAWSTAIVGQSLDPSGTVEESLCVTTAWSPTTFVLSQDFDSSSAVIESFCVTTAAWSPDIAEESSDLDTSGAVDD